MNLKSSHHKTLLISAALCIALTACGGGGTDATPAPAPAAATFADCFVITPGVAFTTKGDMQEKVLGVREPFEGTMRTGISSGPLSTGIKDIVAYWSPESDAIHFWGEVHYNNPDHSASSKVSAPGYSLPLTMQAGQSVSLDYTETTTFLSDGRTSTDAHKATVTFEGFETVTLGGKVFENACRIKTVDPTDPAGGASTEWFAKGFGIIRSRSVDGTGKVVSEVALDSITAQP